MKWIDERGRLGGGPVHLFDLMLVLAALFLLLSFRLPGARSASSPVKGEIATPVRTTKTLVGKIPRPVPAVIDDVLLLLPDLDRETAKKIRVGHMDTGDRHTVVEIIDVKGMPKETRAALPEPLTHPPRKAADPRPVRVRLRIQARIHWNRKVGPGAYLFYKGKPLKPNQTYHFIGPGYVLTGTIIHMNDIEPRRQKHGRKSSLKTGRRRR